MRFSILFLLCFSLSFGQQSQRQADSLKSILKTNTVSFKERIKILNKLTQLYSRFDLKQAKSLNNQIYTLSKPKNYLNGLGFYYQNLVEFDLYSKDFKSTELLTKKAQWYFIKANDTDSYLRSIYNNCFALDFHGKYQEAKQLAVNTINRYENKTNTIGLAELYYYLSTIYNNDRKTTTAFLYLDKALNIYYNQKNRIGIFKCYYQLASISTLNKMYQKSIRYLDKCQELIESKLDVTIESKIIVHLFYSQNFLYARNYSKALYHSKIVEEYLQELQSDYLLLHNSLVLIKTFTKLKSFKEAKQYINKVEIMSNLDDYSQLQFGIAKGDYFLATHNYLKALEIGQKNYSKDSLDTENLKLLAASSYALQDYQKAFTYQQQVLRENEKDYNLKKNDQIVEYEGLFQIKEKDIELANSKLKVKNREIQLERQKTVIRLAIITITGLCIIFILLAYNYYTKRKSIRITKQKNEALARVNDLLTQSNLEKEILLKEIHHRVKNNLQLVMSLLNIQAQDSQQNSIQEFLEKGRLRIATMSLIHQTLYQTDNFANINFQEYLENLVTNIKQTFEENSVDVEVQTNGTTFDLDTAIPLGLIINELVCNALKHAFPKDLKGRISIAIEKKDGQAYELRVGDNGVGVAGNVATKGSKSIGLELVSLLVMQLQGTLKRVNQTGTHYSIQFIP